MSQFENIKQLIVNAKILPVALKHSVKKIAAVVAGLSIILVYQNCSSPTPDLSQYTGSSVAPGPTATGLRIQITSPVGKICTIPASSHPVPCGGLLGSIGLSCGGVITDPGGVDVMLTAIGGNASSKYRFDLKDPADTSASAPVSIGSIEQAPVGFSKNDVVIYHVPPVTTDTVVTVYVYDSNVMNSAIGKISFTVGALHASVDILASTAANAPFVISDCGVGSTVTIEAWGGGGGGGGGDGGGAGGKGGGGAYVKNLIEGITKNDVLEIIVGGGGGKGLDNSAGTGGGAGGVSGGGAGGNAGPAGSSGSGGGGGGYTRVLALDASKTGIQQGLNIATAAGGGGGGGGGVYLAAANGGGGGVSGASTTYASYIGAGGIFGASTTPAGVNGVNAPGDTGGGGGGGGGVNGGGGGGYNAIGNMGGGGGGGGTSSAQAFGSISKPIPVIVNGGSPAAGNQIGTAQGLPINYGEGGAPGNGGAVVSTSGKPGMVRISW